MMTDPRPVRMLNQLMARYPDAPAFVEEMLLDRGKSLPEWPDWCLLPIAGWQLVLARRHGKWPLPPQIMVKVADLAAIGTWRYSQGIYRIDPDLMAAVTDSDISGPMPSDILTRLPEWSVYVETPGMRWMRHALHGFWAHLEWDAETGRSELRFLMDCEGQTIPQPLHLGKWTITEAVEKATAEAERQAKMAGVKLNTGEDLIRDLSRGIAPLLSLLLYLCSEEPEIDDARVPGSSPSRAQMTKTKRGWRLFPAAGPRVWKVGEKIGEHLRDATGRGGGVPGRTVRAHLRRAHWHGYWTGPREGEQKFTYHWIPPTVVGG